jgi:hypothetical protein
MATATGGKRSLLTAASEAAALPVDAVSSPAGARKLLDEYKTQFDTAGSSAIFSGLPLPAGTTLNTNAEFITPNPGNGGSSAAVTGLGNALTSGLGADGIVVGADAGTTQNGGVDNEIRIVSLPTRVLFRRSPACLAARLHLGTRACLSGVEATTPGVRATPCAGLQSSATEPARVSAFHRTARSTRAASTLPPLRPSRPTCGWRTPTRPLCTRSARLA